MISTRLLIHQKLVIWKGEQKELTMIFGDIKETLQVNHTI
jgi:hypothetical protein